MNDTSSLHNISTETLEKNVRNEISVSKKFIMNFMNDAPSACEDIVVNNNYWLEAIVNKNSQYDALSKENEKYSYDIVYVDGEIEYTIKQTEILKEHINEIETLIKETVVKLKEFEHEKDVACEKLVNKHNALKKAIKYYKTLLNMYMRVEKEKDVFMVNICFFTQKFDDTYSFVISKNVNDDKWTLNSVKPPLEEFQFRALLKRFNSSNNISGLVCTVRQILMIYKNSRK